MMKKSSLFIVIFFFSVEIFSQISAGEFDPGRFNFRALGPYRVGSWITEIVVPQSNNPKYDYTYYIGTRNGGIWKTENNGTTFFPVFDTVTSLSIGGFSACSFKP